MPNIRNKSIQPAGGFNHAEAWKVKNTTGATIAANKIVYVNGVSGGRGTIALASNAAAVSCQGRLMITKHDIPNGSFGIVLPWKILEGQNTNGATLGDLRWVGTAGALLAAAPGGGAVVRPIGIVIKVDATDGAILIDTLAEL